MAGRRLKEGSLRPGLEYTPDELVLNGVANVVLYWNGQDGPQLILYAAGTEVHHRYTFSNDSFKKVLAEHAPIVGSYTGGESEPHTDAHSLKDETSSTANKHVHCLLPTAAGLDDAQMEAAFAAFIDRLAHQGLLTYREAANCRAFFDQHNWA